MSGMMMKYVFMFMVWCGVSVLGQVNFWVCVYFLGAMAVFSGVLNPGFNMMVLEGAECSLDTLSYVLWVLSIWLIILMLLSSFSIMSNGYSFKYFLYLMNLMLFLLLLTFCSSNYLGFYFYFEGSLIPTILVIVGWGYQSERLQAGVYFLFYTVVASLPLLVMIMVYYSSAGSMTMGVLVSEFTGAGLSYLSLVAFTSAFLVKMPMFMVHLWLPKAHVEAPVAGSMILAGVLLKLGGYGLCRVLMKVPGELISASSLFVSIGLMSLVMVGLMCCRLNDMSALVAYSSVAHMSLVIMGLYIMGVVGFTGALVMMLAHGLASSGLFSILNMYYERTGSRSFYVNKGLLMVLPSFGLMFFMLCGSNMGSPPSVNLLAEIYLMGSIMGFDLLMVLLFPLGSFLGVVFTVFLFSYSQHGKMSVYASGYWGVYLIELQSLVMHVGPLNFLFLSFDALCLWV